ncbi:sulfatase-like hydrolase/transferase [Lewinella sp. LCG006]|uniref:sulfatase-like hydrolase/transferase n=1 Tax=Lewinella sp. LCG006 TaxID=3231911 RepID=UPI003461476D
MRITYLLFLGSLFLLTSVQKEEADPPNIIFIMVDDLGYADLGCYGQQVIQTPRIDALAAEGIRFTQCYAGSTVCAPSRSVLITGQHTGHTTVRGNMGIGGVIGLGGAAGRIPLQAQDTTIAELLKTAGYTTGMIGKWGLGEPATTGMPDQQGFDYFYGYLNQRRAHTYFPDYVWRNDQRVEFPENENSRHNDYIQNHFLAESLDFIERHHKEPFFLYLPYTLPHDEYEIDHQGRFADSTHWTEPERTYAAMVERMDRDVGRVLDQLDKYGLAENTMVFFCSDNGAAQRWDGRFDSSGPLRGRKRDLYEGGIRVPMIVRFPGQIAAGSSSDLPWTFADVLPTLCAIANVKPPVNIDGSNLWGHFMGQVSEAPLYDRTLYWEFHERGFQQAVRKSNYKAIRLGPDQAWELYNLYNDPGEEENIAEKFPLITKELSGEATKEHVPSHFFPILREGVRRKVVLIGDSTVKNGSKDEDLCGWGEVLTPFFDTTKVEIINQARGGRSSKTYLKEGLWAETLAMVGEGDFVIMQFGHNDGGPIFTQKERGSLLGTGEGFQIEKLSSTDQADTVHTYGWYLRQYIRDTKAKGAIPIVCSMVPRNRWVDGAVERTADSYGGWAAQVAREEQTYFIDLNENVAAIYDTIGEEQLWKQYFKEDHTHTTCYGAELNAKSVALGLRELPYCPLATFLNLPK